jgi:hypothetical protein
MIFLKVLSNYLLELFRLGRKETAWVDRFVVEPQLVMEVRASRPAGRADKSHKLSTLKRSTNLNLDLREVTEAADQPVSVVYLDHVAVTALPAGFGHDTTGRRHDKVAPLAIYIHARVKLIIASTERATPKAEFIIDLTSVCPNRGQESWVASRLQKTQLRFDGHCIAIGRPRVSWAAAVHHITGRW